MSELSAPLFKGYAINCLLIVIIIMAFAVLILQQHAKRT